MAFQFQRLEIPEVILIKIHSTSDELGFFRETYSESQFLGNGIPQVFVQENFASSARGVLRGLHYQKMPKAQAKYVVVYDGQIYDVAVDIRKGSPTYGKWVGVELSADNGLALYVPTGFAHGYCVLSENAAVTYKVTELYVPEFERGIVWNDPQLAIDWPIAEPILAARDANFPLLKNADNNFKYEASPNQ